MTDTEQEALVQAYLDRLRTALSPLDASKREQLISEISEHVEEARSTLHVETKASLLELLERIGQPEEIAAEALGDRPGKEGRHSTRRRNALIAGVLIVLAIVSVSLALLLTRGHSPSQPHRSSSTPIVTLPNVVGESTTRATKALLALGLNFNTEYKTSATIPEGVVISQKPNSGSKVVRGSRVILTVSSGSTTVSATSQLKNGIYVNGQQGTPHYFISLASNGDNLSGSVDFLYQDGQTSVVFTFSGTLQNAVATIHPIDIPQNSGSASQEASSVPSAISATVGENSIALGECPAYLHFVQSMAQCQFTYSSAGIT